MAKKTKRNQERPTIQQTAWMQYVTLGSGSGFRIRSYHDIVKREPHHCLYRFCYVHIVESEAAADRKFCILYVVFCIYHWISIKRTN